ncbi:hypothetical protein ACSQ67_011459 [Phaseolus vulgaris]
MSESSGRSRYLMVVGINIAFSNEKRRDSIREKRKKLEEEKGIIIRFVIGHRIMLKDTLNCRQRQRPTLLPLVNLWDADFYIKVDDDVHVNIGFFKLFHMDSCFILFTPFSSNTRTNSSETPIKTTGVHWMHEIRPVLSQK